MILALLQRSSVCGDAVAISGQVTYMVHIQVLKRRAAIKYIIKD
jgi:hypothetical protein